MKGIFPIDKFRTLQTPFYYYDTKVLRDTLSAINQEDRKSTRLNSSHIEESRMPSSA